jgi:hypothetical protein
MAAASPSSYKPRRSDWSLFVASLRVIVQMSFKMGSISFNVVQFRSMSFNGVNFDYVNFDAAKDYLFE